MPKQQVTVWVDASVAKVIHAQAAQQKSSASQVSAKLLKAAVRGEYGSVGVEEAILKLFEEAVNRSMRQAVGGLASLVSNGTLSAIAGRLEVGHLLEREFGVEASQRIKNEAWRRAIEALRKPLEP